MSAEFVAEHRCGYAILVTEDVTGWWRYSIDVPARPGVRLDISHCPGCRRRLTRRSLLVLDRDVRRGVGS